MRDPTNFDDANGLKIERANVITQVTNQNISSGFRGLILINGGGAAALGAFVQAVWGKPTAAPMLSWVLYGIIWLLLGTALAAIGFMAHHLAFFHHNATQPFKNPWWWGEIAITLLSVLFFLFGMCTAVFGAFVALRCS